ncbi:hypothetical protein AAG570_004613 [Ranatra chinensis]|uniref:Uncharacterized protein n=1 Tax=Ranatra chinensis TaxID=642074 RepID=A0ABD0Y1D4_9HEMI
MTSRSAMFAFNALLAVLSTFATSDRQRDWRWQSTDLVSGENDVLLVLSTLNGSLIGISRNTGEIKWRINNEPAVKVPLNTANAIVPIFLPDPKDGSLYLMKLGESNILKKLPFSIQHLVASSPCKSNDGIFYTGKKVDSWFSVDWKTGKKTSMISFDSAERTCPLASSNSLFIGRTGDYPILLNLYLLAELDGSVGCKFVDLDRFQLFDIVSGTKALPTIHKHTTRDDEPKQF